MTEIMKQTCSKGMFINDKKREKRISTISQQMFHVKHYNGLFLIADILLGNLGSREFVLEYI